MSWKSKMLKPLARKVSKDMHKWSSNAIKAQDHVFKYLIKSAKKTAFGKDHEFESIDNYEQFKKSIPIRDYEAFRPYINRIIDGEKGVLWKGRPKYFAKTSGTTSGVKYIPLTKESIPNHFGTARNALFNYYFKSGNGSFFDGKMIFLSGSPALTKTGNILTGRLSGIVNHQVPAWLRKNQLPSYTTNCIEAWEEKLDHIVEETISQDMRLISGIPPWVIMYYEQLLAKSGKKDISSLYKKLSIFVYGGVNFKPYKARLEELVGKPIDTLETYPASEGFIAFQDELDNEGLLLNVRSGIFFEFIPLDSFHSDAPERLSLDSVSLGINYVIIINSNAGLWGYNIGDTVMFVSLNPYRIVVTGRIKHFISAFGEHVIGKEVETALHKATQLHPCKVIEFTVAPQVNPGDEGLPRHEWYIEFETPPENIDKFTTDLDRFMVEQNIYYKDLIQGRILQPLVIRKIVKGGFILYMKSMGKLGGQNKVPRLSNDRTIADELQPYVKD